MQGPYHEYDGIIVYYFFKTQNVKEFLRLNGASCAGFNGGIKPSNSREISFNIAS
tara:strand:- start:258 stop:422 length:165 start_codon:yes stop_codon:yes gene_type:complete